MASQTVDIFKLLTSQPIFPAAAPLSQGQVKKGRRKYHFQGTSRPYWQATYCVSRNFFISCMMPRVCFPRIFEEEEEIYLELDHEQLMIVTRRERNMSQARGDSMLKLTANRETLIHTTPEHAEAARTVENRQFNITNEFVVARNSRYPRSRAVRKDLVKIGSVTEIAVFESAEASPIEAQVPSRQPGNMKSWPRISRGIEQYARQFILEDTERQSCGVPSPQCSSCGRLGAQTHGEQSQVRFKAVPMQRKRIVNSKMSKHFTNSLRCGGCHEPDGDEWLDVRSRSTDKHRIDKATVMGSQSIQICVLFETDTVALERIHIPHRQLFQLLTNPREWTVGRRFEPKKHKTNLFLLSSNSAIIVIATVHHQQDRTRR